MLITQKDNDKLEMLKRQAEYYHSLEVLYHEDLSEEIKNVNNEITKLEVRLGISKLDDLMDAPMKQLDEIFNFQVHQAIDNL